MKVKELMELLSNYNQEDEVYMEVSSNDYWRNKLAVEIKYTSIVYAEESDYYDGQLKIKDDYGEDCREVLIIGC